MLRINCILEAVVTLMFTQVAKTKPYRSNAFNIFVILALKIAVHKRSHKLYDKNF